MKENQEIIFFDMESFFLYYKTTLKKTEGKSHLGKVILQSL